MPPYFIHFQAATAKQHPVALNWKQRRPKTSKLKCSFFQRCLFSVSLLSRSRASSLLSCKFWASKLSVTQTTLLLKTLHLVFLPAGSRDPEIPGSREFSLSRIPWQNPGIPKSRYFSISMIFAFLMIKKLSFFSKFDKLFSDLKILCNFWLISIICH